MTKWRDADMASAACSALHALADSFLAAGSPMQVRKRAAGVQVVWHGGWQSPCVKSGGSWGLVQAIKCCTAACLSPELPEVEARSLLHLAKLLLRHTRNASQARQHLHKAVRRTVSWLLCTLAKIQPLHAFTHRNRVRIAQLGDHSCTSHMLLQNSSSTCKGFAVDRQASSDHI